MTHQEYAEGLRKFAVWVEQHTELALPSSNIENFVMDTKEEAAALVRALGSCQKEYSDWSLTIKKDFGPITLRAVFRRNNVCRRVVVGSETIPAKFIEAYVEPARTKEIVKWECDPILEPTSEPA